eukprot:TRINITY_DN1457_c0_g1_i1.p1 TRINITY_DN1457_c0_g1~~TRINITY_DN1457_c0_g1_i1.p1  ORF type:complete len:617 (+),score=84.84 TRINITY_DN1457_c0_g1_i1:91-1941(+)
MDGDSPQGVKVGVLRYCVPDLSNAVHELTDKQLDFICVPLAHPRFERRLTKVSGNTLSRQLPFTRSDVLLGSNHWSTVIVGMISPWISFDDSDLQVNLSNNRLALDEEISWAKHLSLSAILIPKPSWNCAAYASALNQNLLETNYMQIWVTIPLTHPKPLRSTTSSTSQETPSTDAWDYWNKFRTLCEHSSRLFVALEVTADLPPQEEWNNWVGEPVKVLILPTTSFLTNPKGFPVLSKMHQQFVSKFFDFNVSFVIAGYPSHPQGVSVYQTYINYLYSKHPPLTQTQKYERPYWDYLQSPLQPLMDNLESQTYEVFEKDPVKYKKYEEAVYQALISGKFKAPGVLMVLGAGRGPLVRASLRASKRAHFTLHIYAVEKNPNAIVTLLNMKRFLGWSNVDIISADMRTWVAPTKADIIVSELLGSFGDNELSPECLAGVTHHLKENGISIPSAYTSYLAPLSSHKLYNEVKTFKDAAHFETAYVVQFHNARILDDPKPCFSFIHPDPDSGDLTRFTTLKFKIKHNSLMHGFAGYFDATLYEDVHISIYPPTFTQGMFSWFPIYFPIQVPIYLPAGCEVEVNFWRLESSKKVWYEWCVTKPTMTLIHNARGRSYTIDK